MPNNLTSISTGAFQSCLLLNLTSLPSGITSIGDSAFYRCSNLALTSLPSNITTIGENAFYNCSKLALTSLPNNLTSISNATFQSCPLLNLTSLPSGITSIGSYAFQNCTSLTLSSLPDSITTIKDGAFSGCSGLTSINCNGIITTLSPGAFCLSNSAQSAMNLVSVNFPNMAASTLNTVFGSSTASLACSLLQFIDIGNTQKIGSNSLLNCSSLKTLVLRRSDAICSLASTSAFTGTPFATGGTGGTVYVPSALISTYQTATN